jgi:hypothetical protein
MTRIFSAMGFDVVLQKGLKRHVEGRVVINQVDLTVTPPEYAAYMDDFPIALNGHLLDISKTITCPEETFVSLQQHYDGPVIVKTQLNHGGSGEKQAFQGVCGPGCRITQVFQRLFDPESGTDHDWRTTRYLEPRNYPIFSTPEHVPAGVWDNKNLVVQRLYTERDEDGLYCLRFWYVLGDRDFHVVCKGNDPVIKGNNIIRRQVVEIDTPVSLLLSRQRLGVDFGRFDYILVDGEAVVLDVNRTPTMSAAAIGHYRHQWLDLAHGIFNYMD